MGTKASEWVASIAPAAQKASASTGMSYQLMLAQAAQETGWGQRVLQKILLSLALLFGGQWAIAESPPPRLLRDGLDDVDFAAAYRAAFGNYMGLKWVSRPTLETLAETRVLKSGTVLSLYSACRPHACSQEFLYFVYDFSSKRGWGVLNVLSDATGKTNPPREIKELLLKEGEKSLKQGLELRQ
jgi:hypothetical protein